MLGAVYDQRRVEGARFSDEGGARIVVDRHDPGDEVSGGSQVLRRNLRHHLLNRGANLGPGLRTFELSEVCGLEKMVGVFDRGGLGDHDQDASAGDQKEVENVESASGAEIDDDVIGVERTDVAQDLTLLAVIGVCHLEQRLRTADQPQVVDGGRYCHIRQLLHPTGHKVR
ncbi:MAG: hypothetical protein P8Y93_03995 [Acidobacteriota bacterium]